MQTFILQIFISSALMLMAFLVAPAALAGNAENGKKVFIKCGACHSVEKDVPKVGPSLFNVVGRKAGTLASFKLYSPAMKETDIVWDEKSIAEFMKSPRSYIKGTRMIFIGLKDEEQITDLIAYLKTLK